MVIFLYYSRIIAGSSNGRTWAFEAQYLGSSPSPAAKLNDTNLLIFKFRVRFVKSLRVF